MKATLEEYEGCFSIDLQAETMEEAIKMARFGIGKLNQLRSSGVVFGQNATAELSVIIGKSVTKSSRL